MDSDDHGQRVVVASTVPAAGEPVGRNRTEGRRSVAVEVASCPEAVADPPTGRTAAVVFPGLLMVAAAQTVVVVLMILLAAFVATTTVHQRS